MTQMGNICFVFLILRIRNPPMEIREIVGIYVAQVILTNARLGFWGTLHSFLQVAKTAILGKILTRFSNGGLLFHNWDEYVSK